MSREELIEVLNLWAVPDGDTEIAHHQADLALLEYINDPDVTKAYEAITKWYA